MFGKFHNMYFSVDSLWYGWLPVWKTRQVWLLHVDPVWLQVLRFSPRALCHLIQELGNYFWNFYYHSTNRSLHIIETRQIRSYTKKKTFILYNTEFYINSSILSLKFLQKFKFIFYTFLLTSNIWYPVLNLPNPLHYTSFLIYIISLLKKVYSP